MLALLIDVLSLFRHFIAMGTGAVMGEADAAQVGSLALACTPFLE